MVFLARPPTRVEPQPLSRALCSRGSHRCRTVTVLIVVCLSDLATKRQKRRLVRRSQSDKQAEKHRFVSLENFAL